MKTHCLTSNLQQSNRPNRIMSEPAQSTYDYDQYHLNGPVPGLETGDEHYFRLNFLDDAVTSFVTNEMSDDSSSSSEEESSTDEDDQCLDNDSVPPAELSYESDNEETETEDDSSEAEGSDDEGFNESDYESVCTLEDCPDDQTLDDDASSSFQSSEVRRRQLHDHELFLPRDISSEHEQLKYDDVGESEEEEISAYHRTSTTYLTITNRNFRPRMRMLLPPKRLYERRPSPSNISDDSSEDDVSVHSQDCKPATIATRGVSFDNNVTVHPIFETNCYTTTMLDSMYTTRDELRINKLRNRREFAYDDNSWENATEECDMETDEDGEYVHPVHTQKRTFTRGPFLSTASTSIWKPSSATVVHRSKRMRMHYP